MWSKKSASSGVRHVYFFPGEREEEAVANLYCDHHAAKVSRGLKPGASASGTQPSSNSRKATRVATSSSLQRRRVSGAREMTRAPSEIPRRMKAAPAAARARASPPMPGLARSTSDGRAATSTSNSNLINGYSNRGWTDSKAAARRASQREAQLLDRNDAKAIKKPKRGPLSLGATGEQHTAAPTARPIQDVSKEVLEDVLEEYLSYTDKTRRVDFLTGKKIYWKRKLSHEMRMSNGDFLEKIWIPVKAKCNETRKSRNNLGSLPGNGSGNASENVEIGAEDNSRAAMPRHHENPGSLEDTDGEAVPSQPVSLPREMNNNGDVDQAMESSDQSRKAIDDRDSHNGDINNRWSRFVVGPSYDGRGFVFDEWDTFGPIGVNLTHREREERQESESAW